MSLVVSLRIMMFSETICNLKASPKHVIWKIFVFSMLPFMHWHMSPKPLPSSPCPFFGNPLPISPLNGHYWFLTIGFPLTSMGFRLKIWTLVMFTVPALNWTWVHSAQPYMVLGLWSYLLNTMEFCLWEVSIYCFLLLGPLFGIYSFPVELL